MTATDRATARAIASGHPSVFRRDPGCASPPVRQPVSSAASSADGAALHELVTSILDAADRLRALKRPRSSRPN